ncbi:MAG: PspC domain-containing protein [Chitinophagaceae bacterium]|nr:MAG: PspC domain-containing protein [Chitinophagaceae bacterium]
MNRLKEFIEWQAFGVCTAIGDRMGIATSRIRMWFIYISFLTLGSPVIVYMVLAFWMNMKRYIFAARRNPWWNL